MDNNAFIKKTGSVTRPLTSYIQASQRKYLNFDFGDMRASLKQIDGLQNPNCVDIHASKGLAAHTGTPFVETNKKLTKVQTGCSNENTDNSNTREYRLKHEVTKMSSDHSEVLTSVISGDGKQHIISRCLGGDNLKTATEHEIVQSNNEKRRVYPLLVDLGAKLLNYEPTKVSTKQVGIVSCYSANTNLGISRNYNEDRVSIILNISKEATKCSIFAIYDGHGGTTCCDYLRDNLHQNIIGNASFPSNPKQAIINGVRQTEQHLMSKLEQNAFKNAKLDKSGSCGIMAIIMGHECLLANIGDSRAVLSADGGRFSYNLSRDHKPIDPLQQKRILMSGGRIYRTQMFPVSNPRQQPVYGPLRVFPGKLSVSRTFGDIEAKHQKLGGNSKVVIAQPQIKQFLIKQNHDFIILGCDGIFDKIESKQIVKLVWQTVQLYKDQLETRGDQEVNLHQLCGRCVQTVMREAMNRRSMDNLTVVMVAFEGFENRVRQGGNKYMTTSLKSMKSDTRSPRQYDV